MAEYEVLLKASAIKELEKLPKAVCERVLRKIEALKDEPRPMGVIKLAVGGLFRIRQGDYRIVYAVDDKELKVEVIKIGHRSDVYS